MSETKRDLVVAEFGRFLEEVPDESSNQSHWLVGYAYEFFKARLDELYHTLGGDVAAVEATIRAAYKAYAEPIDLPGVPNLVVEPLVDDYLEDMLVKLVLSGHDFVHAK